MPTYIYVRVSGVTSAESGLSEEAQIATSLAFNRRIGGEIGSYQYPIDAPPGVFIDRAISGRTAFNERPAGAALSAVLKPGDTVIFYNVERSFRSVKNWSDTIENWLENGINPCFAQQQINFSTATGRLMGNMLASLAQYYSDIISQRCKEAHAIRELNKLNRYSTKKNRKWENSNVVVFSPRNNAAVELPGVVRIYNRVSSLDQQLSGLSMEVQRKANANFAQMLVDTKSNLSIHEELYEDESISAFKLNFEERPAAKRLLEDLKPGDHIVVYRHDRAFRQPGQAVKLFEHTAKIGATLHLVSDGISSDTEMGKLWITALATFASIESQIKSERNKEIAENLRRNGRPVNQRELPWAKFVDEPGGKKRLRYCKKKMVVLAKAAILKHLGYNNVVVVNFLGACQAMRQEKAHSRPTGLSTPSLLRERISKFIEICNSKIHHDLAFQIFVIAWHELETKRPVRPVLNNLDEKMKSARMVASILSCLGLSYGETSQSSVE